ncbi:hypothetical protein VTN77DRAFT_982 [Rasamsonia byssochlamydoides]|uniref:uncharacterized protein n=1 Tax=Rasamsonia byssochlamydoides TaxID=89139 RepID=UPI0037442D47
MEDKKIILTLPAKYSSSSSSSSSSSPSPPSSSQPTLPQLLGNWFITRSSSAFWRDKRNVSISYALDSSSSNSNNDSKGSVSDAAAPDPAGPKPNNVLLDGDTSNLVLHTLTSYQSLSSDAVKSTRGTDRPVRGAAGSGAGTGTGTGTITMEWRGTGLLRLVSNRWEILGYGSSSSSSKKKECNNDYDNNEGIEEDSSYAWMVVYAEKSMFTPAGISVYSRWKRGLPEKVAGAIQDALMELVERHDDDDDDDDDGFRLLVEGMCDIRQD